MTNGTNGSGSLRAELKAAMRHGYRMKDLTVLSAARDPFRLDTPAGDRDADWLAGHVARFEQDRTRHLRGFHYALIGETKPDGKPYTNTDDDWTWLCERAAKAARWLGRIAFDRLQDQRNAAPRIREYAEPQPEPVVAFGAVELQLPDDLDPNMRLRDFRGVQAYRLALFAEKVSMESVLAPLAETYGADLYLPTGEPSDTMIATLARTASDDGRPLVVLYVADADPSGWQMPLSVARKLQALRTLMFPALEFEVRRVALTPDQVRAVGLPSTPLKTTELRADRWQEAMGVAQTELDSLLDPNHPERIDWIQNAVRQAVRPFFDSELDQRVREVRREWEAEAQAALVDQLGEGEREQLREAAEERLAELQDQVAEINDSLRVDPTGMEFPEPPAIPHAESAGADDEPLIASEWGYADATLRLRAQRAYEETT